GAADHDAAHRYRLADSHVLVVEGGAGVAVHQVVARDAVVRKGNGGGGGSVESLVDAAGVHAQGAGRDVGRGRGRGVEGVVVRVGAADHDAADDHLLAGTRVLVAVRRAAIAGREVVAGHAVIRKGDGGGGRAVVNLADAAGAHGQGAGGDVRRGRRRGVEGV